jgi:hypothetical protein
MRVQDGYSTAITVHLLSHNLAGHRWLQGRARQ